jgi:hypothetical protein
MYSNWDVWFEKYTIWQPRSGLQSLIAAKADGNGLEQGCQMVYFQTKNPNLGKFLRALD